MDIQSVVVQHIEYNKENLEELARRTGTSVRWLKSQIYSDRPSKKGPSLISVQAILVDAGFELKKLRYESGRLSYGSNKAALVDSMHSKVAA